MLPHTLRVLRLDGTRVRTFPRQLPAGILELYAAACDFFTLPDLSAYTELIVIEMPDNRIERLIEPLPPNLARLNLKQNAVREVLIPVPPDSLQSIDFSENPGIRKVLKEENAAYTVKMQLARQANPENPVFPHRPPSVIPRWVLAHSDARLILEDNRGIGATTKNPYTNSQSVHDSGIQNSTRANLDYLAPFAKKTPSSTEEFMSSVRSILSPSTLKSCISVLLPGDSSINEVLRELMIRMNQEYVMHGYTPKSIIRGVWGRIQELPDSTRKEAIQRFKEEILEGAPFCTNGFMVRMANVLVGFDENIIMQMQPAQIMQGRIPATLQRLLKKYPNEGADYWKEAILQTWTDMNELAMTDDERTSWIAPLADAIAEYLHSSIHTRTMWEVVGPDGNKIDRLMDVITAAGLTADGTSRYNKNLSQYIYDVAAESLREKLGRSAST
jgi:DNA-directed RNA polymerase subunit F